MPTYEVELAHRQSGATSTVEVEAMSTAEAAQEALADYPQHVVGSVRELPPPHMHVEFTAPVRPPSPREFVLAFRDSRDYWKRHTRSVANGVALGIWYAMLAPVALAAILAVIAALSGGFNR